MPIHLGPITRREFLVRSAAAGAAALLPRAAYALAAGSTGADPHSFVLMSDTHITVDPRTKRLGINMAEHFAKAATEIAALKVKPSGVIHTGDCAHTKGLAGEYVQFGQILSRIVRAKIPVHLGMGNHDHRVGADAIEWALEAQGIAVLRNRHVRLQRNGSALTVAGVDDLGYCEHDLRLALLGADLNDITILLCHNPAVLPLAVARGVDLVVSGHTHGGQMDMPRLRSFADKRGVRVPMRFRHGWDRVNGTQIYISRGLGTVVVPLRWRCPAEISVLHLQATNGYATDVVHRS